MVPAGDEGTTLLGVSENSVHQSSVHTGIDEQSNGFVVPNRTTSGRVASPSRSGRTGMAVWCGARGSTADRCTISNMARRVIVRFPSPTPDSPSTQEDSVRSSHGLPCCPKMAKEALVPNTYTTGSGSSFAITEESRPVVSSRKSNLAPKARESAAVGLAIAQPPSKNLDEAVLRTLNHYKASSTWNIYSSKWRIFPE